MTSEGLKPLTERIDLASRCIVALDLVTFDNVDVGL